MILDTIFGSLEDSANEPAPNTQGQPDQQGQEPSQAPVQEEPQGQAPETGQPESPVDDDSKQGQPEGSQFKSFEDLQRSYQELRSAYNRRDQEISQLRQQNQQLMAYLQQLMYSGYSQGQPQQQAPAQAPQKQVDPEQWFEELQRKGPAVVQEIVNRELERQGRELGLQLQQLLLPIFQHYQLSQTREAIASQVRQVAAKYPDVAQYSSEIEKVVNENPNLLFLPNGVEIAYQAAKLRVLERNTQQQQSQVQKRAAQMPSTGASRPGPQPTPEDIIRQQVFGASGSTKGIFD